MNRLFPTTGTERDGDFLSLERTAPAAPARKVYGVAELTRFIKTTLENEIGSVWLEGELSNFIKASSGHLYFTLKDADAQIRGAMFRGSTMSMKFEPRDGMKVRVQGEITVYEKRGEYQIIVKRMEEAGKGSLQEQFEKLKAKLQAEGLFDAARKKKFPVLPQRIGIVTSPTGAVIRDIINVLKRRFPNLIIRLIPVRVQGAGAAEEIAAAVDQFNAWRGAADVLIVGRGGGSLEDLWAFNEEVVARAVARSQIPVISAVGHETDFTICDFVADLRAPTPSAAAELVVQAKGVWEETLRSHARHLAAALENKLLAFKNRYTRVARSYVFREPQNLAKNYRQRIETQRGKLASLLLGAAQQQQQRIDELEMRIGHRMEIAIQDFRRQIEKSRDRLAPALFDVRMKKSQRVGELAMRIGHRMEVVTQSRRQKIERLESQLRALGPLAVLDRGYSITQTEDGKVVRDAAQVAAGTKLKTRVAKGVIASEVIKS